MINRRQAIKLMATIPVVGTLTNAVKGEEIGHQSEETKLPVIKFYAANRVSNFEEILKDSEFESVNLESRVFKDFDDIEIREIINYHKSIYEHIMSLEINKVKVCKVLAWLPQESAINYSSSNCDCHCYYGMVNVVQFGMELSPGNFKYIHAILRTEKSKIIHMDENLGGFSCSRDLNKKFTTPKNLNCT